jgi:hypothetical protein
MGGPEFLRVSGPEFLRQISFCNKSAEQNEDLLDGAFESNRLENCKVFLTRTIATFGHRDH